MNTDTISNISERHHNINEKIKQEVKKSHYSHRNPSRRTHYLHKKLVSSLFSARVK